jgi:hypothetical protein
MKTMAWDSSDLEMAMASLTVAVGAFMIQNLIVFEILKDC